MTRDMTKGSPLSRILAFCAPLLVGNLFQQFYNLADSILVGRILGVEAFAAVGATGALNFLILGFALGICSGFAIPIAQSFGAGDMDTVRSRTAQTVWLGALFAGAITLITFFFTDDILRLMRTPEEIFDEACRYIFIVFMGTGFTILYNLSSGILRSLGDSRTPLHFLIAAVSLNVLLDLLFMGKLGMGVEGAAYATVLSQAASGLACVFYMRKKVPVLRLSVCDLRPNLRRMGTIAAIGVPMGLQFSITAVGSIILQSAVNGGRGGVRRGEGPQHRSGAAGDLRHGDGHLLRPEPRRGQGGPHPPGPAVHDGGELSVLRARVPVQFLRGPHRGHAVYRRI